MKMIKRSTQKKKPKVGGGIGGSMFIHNAVQFDYCVAEAVASLCAVCDEVVVTDCSSTDETLDILKDCRNRHANLRVVEGLPWEIGHKHTRLVEQANIAKSHLKTEWHFMLQADEVIHENSFQAIRSAPERHYRSYMSRRYNLFGDLNHYLRFDIPQNIKPCNDQVIRLATIEFDACGDAEYLQVDPATITHKWLDEINIIHYGLVRSDEHLLDKCIDMQGWFFGQKGFADPRIIEMKATSKRYEWEQMHPKENLAPLPFPHPIFSREWAAKRQEKKIPV